MNSASHLHHQVQLAYVFVTIDLAKLLFYSTMECTELSIVLLAVQVGRIKSIRCELGSLADMS